MDTNELMSALRDAVASGVAPGCAARAELARLADPLQVKRSGKILSGLRETSGELRPLTVAVAATCTVGGFADMLRSRLVAAGMAPVIASAPYGSFEMSLTAPETAGIGAADMLFCLLDGDYFLPSEWSPLDLPDLEKHVLRRCDDLAALVGDYVARWRIPVVLHTVPLSPDVRDTVLSWRSRAALAQIWHRLNVRVLGLTEVHAEVAVIDLVSVLADLGAPARDNRMRAYADMPYTAEALCALADEVRRFAQANAGLSRKVLALDLDNTLWGGILGDDGVQGLAVAGLYPGGCYQRLQRTAARLREQGVILVLASKNDDRLVREVLARHPDVVLRPDAFSAMAVNWEPKSVNLAAAAEELSLSTGAFVFMDDSSFEREEVASALPEVGIVAADGDPADLVDSLVSGGWFDVTDLTDADRARARSYKARADRSEFSGSFGSRQDYLAALELRLIAEPVTSFTAGRAAQLAGRTNQFNLTGVRYDTATTLALGDDPGHLVATFQVADRFGDEGIVGAIWIEREPDVWRVANLVLSCRVLGRGVEFAIAAWIVGQARAVGASRVEGRYVPSGRNGVVASFWPQAGFTLSAGQKEGQVGGESVFTLALTDTACSFPEWITLANSELTS